MKYLSFFKDYPKMKLALHLLVIFSLVSAVCFFRPTAATAGRTASRDELESLTVFSNPAPIVPVDRPSNTAGTNPGLPPAGVYPSIINVTGLTGTVTKVTVTFALTTTWPDDLDVLLVGPTGALSLVMSDAGGSGDHTNVSFTFDQTAAGLMPNDPTTPIPAGSFQPSNYTGLAAPEPGGQDNFPSAGGLMSYPADFNVFNGTNPNGEWKLYVVDDQAIDTSSLPSGWSIDITAGAPVATAGISGRVTSASSGTGLSGVVVVLSGGGLTSPRISRTNPFGYYSFTDVPQGQTYTLTVQSKVFQFANPSQTVMLSSSDVTNANFVGTP